MRYLLPAACAALIAVPVQAGAEDLSMVAIGLPFSPEAPKPLDPTHPLFRGLEVGEIEGLPATVKSSAVNIIAAAKRSSINAALSESLQRMNMLAPAPATARKRLDVRWIGGRAPFHIGTHNSATVTLHYRLVRIDNAQLLFDRDITTAAEGGGVDASMRDNGVMRMAIAANFASAANCLDHAAYGTAPADCALKPLFSVAVVRGER